MYYGQNLGNNDRSIQPSDGKQCARYEEHDNEKTGKIWNGVDAAAGELPWQVLLENGGCGGTLVSMNVSESTPSSILFIFQYIHCSTRISCSNKLQLAYIIYLAIYHLYLQFVNSSEYNYYYATWTRSPGIFLFTTHAPFYRVIREIG